MARPTVRLSARPVLRAVSVRCALSALFVVGLASVSCGSTASNDIATAGSTGFTPRGTDSAGAPVTPVTPVAPTPGSTPSTAAAGGTTTSLGKPALTDASAISTVGLDKVHFGMTVVEAEKAAGSKLTSEANKNPGCYSAKLEAGPEGVAFLISDGRVERVDITGPKIATRSGAKVGSSIADIKKLYGTQIEEQPRPDGQPGGALVFVPKDEGDAKFRLVFMTDGTTVQLYRAGRIPQVLAPTGCK